MKNLFTSILLFTTLFMFHACDVSDPDDPGNKITIYNKLTGDYESNIYVQIAKVEANAIKISPNLSYSYSGLNDGRYYLEVSIPNYTVLRENIYVSGGETIKKEVINKEGKTPWLY